MLAVRKAQERGSFDHGWLKTFHTFSFSQYYDPDFTGFSVLRVINEDRISAGAGFPMHAHRDMEILTYVIDGALAHKDSMGNSSVIHPGEVQRMTAGTGVRHSEFNSLHDRETHLLQIWILPGENSLEPSYEQKEFGHPSEPLFLVASDDGREGSLVIHQDTSVYVGRVPKAPATTQAIFLPLLASRRGWLQLITGEIKLKADESSINVTSGDGVAIENENKVVAECSPGSEFLFFDLP